MLYVHEGSNLQSSISSISSISSSSSSSSTKNSPFSPINPNPQPVGGAGSVPFSKLSGKSWLSARRGWVFHSLPPPLLPTFVAGEEESSNGGDGRRVRYCGFEDEDGCVASIVVACEGGTMFLLFISSAVLASLPACCHPLAF